MILFTHQEEHEEYTLDYCLTLVWV